MNQNGYTYAVASKSTPETLTIYHNGHVVLRTLANTGIPVSPTVDGTFPVYERFRFQIMRGVNPDGSAYADPVSYVSYFNGGDAVHYFPRGSYGFQQSLGCVELPWNSAARAYPYLTYGSLVTVTGSTAASGRGGRAAATPEPLPRELPPGTATMRCRAVPCPGTGCLGVPVTRRSAAATSGSSGESGLQPVAVSLP